MCGKPLTAGWTKGHGGRYGYYQCSRGCTRASKKKLEDAFTALLDRLRPKPGYWALIKAALLDVWRQEQQTESGRRASRASRTRASASSSVGAKRSR